MKYIIFMITVSCATKPLTEKENAVRILMASDASLKCKQLGSIDFSMEAMVTLDKVGLAKRKTAEQGGNVLQATSRNQYGDIVSGLTFLCPSE